MRWSVADVLSKSVEASGVSEDVDRVAASELQGIAIAAETRFSPLFTQKTQNDASPVRRVTLQPEHLGRATAAKYEFVAWNAERGSSAANT